MIDFIEGTIAYVTGDAVVVQAGNIGYRIFCPHSHAIGEEGERVRIYTHQHVRDDFIGLYGFKSMEERELFCQLLNVTGIGPRSALVIIGAGEPTALVQAIYDEDISFLTKIPGVGKKTAQRMILDLKDKLELDVWLRDVTETGRLVQEETAAASPGGVAGEAIEALMNLGYNEKEAKRAVARAQAAMDESDVAVDALIKKALQTFLA